MARSRSSFDKGNSGALKHGGAAAVAAISAGEPLTGLAAREEQAVRDELDSNGRGAMVLTQAVRLTSASNLYWAAVQKAAEEQDLDKLDRYVARFGWLAQSALRAWGEVRKEVGTRDKSDLTAAAIAAAREARGGR